MKKPHPTPLKIPSANHPSGHIIYIKDTDFGAESENTGGCQMINYHGLYLSPFLTDSELHLNYSGLEEEHHQTNLYL